MTDRRTIRLVIVFIGVAVILFGLATVLLAMRVLDQSSGRQTVDAAAVAVVAIPAGFTTTALGFLGGMLVSTRSAPDKGEIDAALGPLAETATTAPVVTINNPEPAAPQPPAADDPPVPP